MDSLYIKKVLNGETEEFRYFVRRYKDMAFSVALSVVKEENKAAEVVQEAFVKAYQNLKKFRGDSKFSSWFYRIVINEAFKNIRQEKEHYHTEVFEEKETTLTKYPEIFNALKEDEQKYYINKCLLKLTSNETLVLRLFYLNESSIKEICEMTGCSNSNVKILLHRARRNMKIMLNKCLKEEAKYLL